MEITETSLKRGRILYIIEAALEYLISLLVAGSFLATLTKNIGISDSVTGVLSSIISLGCLFQLGSMALHPKRVKGLVIVISVIKHLLFVFLYLIPLVEISKTAKTAIFILFILSAYVLYNVVHPKKISWLMSLVDDNKRGSFTANKEIASLIVGMVFTFIMGNVIDRLNANNQTRTSLIISGLVIFSLTVLHSLCMIFTVEKDNLEPPKVPLKENIKYIINNKNLIRVALIFIIYFISKDISVPFYATYQISELGFSLTFVSILTIITSVFRIVVSRFWGRYADKKTFAVMMEKCLILLLIAEICVVFTTPSNAKILFMLYYMLHGISMGGINSAYTNMIFDYVPHEKRSDALAICQASAGAIGFIATILVSPLVSHIQNNGNKLFGINMYAQQFLTILSIVLVILLIIYVKTKIIGKKE